MLRALVVHLLYPLWSPYAISIPLNLKELFSEELNRCFEAMPQIDVLKQCLSGGGVYIGVGNFANIKFNIE